MKFIHNFSIPNLNKYGTCTFRHRRSTCFLGFEANAQAELRAWNALVCPNENYLYTENESVFGNHRQTLP